MMLTVAIDLPNFYNRILESGLDTDKGILKKYFIDWLDFDLLVKRHSNEPFFNIYIFHSQIEMGPEGEGRVGRDEFETYKKRVNDLKGVTSCEVNVGKKRDKNKKDTRPEEKGVDILLCAHLFETMEFWNVAYILTHDGDYAPAVAALRKKGKIVSGFGLREKANEFLVRECFSFIDVLDDLKKDFSLYKLLGHEENLIEKFIGWVYEKNSKIYNQSGWGEKNPKLYVELMGKQSTLPQEWINKINELPNYKEIDTFESANRAFSGKFSLEFEFIDLEIDKINRHFSNGLDENIKLLIENQDK